MIPLIDIISPLEEALKKRDKELEEVYKGVEQLNNIIHKAIVYIENNSYETGSEDMYAINVDELLKILKGDDDL